jgi:hypothetical protein
MRMVSNWLFGFFMIMFLSSSLVSSLTLASGDFSDEYPIGVKAGDWILYQVFATDTIMVNIEWAEVEILNVSGTNITYHVRIHYNNIPEDNLTVNCDMRKLIQGYEFLYGRLGASVPLFVPLSFTAQNFTYDFIIKTLDLPNSWNPEWNFSRAEKDFGGIKRQVNMINESYTTPYDSEHVQSFYGESCWDAQTGVLSEARGISYTPFPVGGVDPKTTETETLLKIVDTNLWEMPYPSNTQIAKVGAFAGILGFVVVLPTVYLAWHKRDDEREE